MTVGVSIAYRHAERALRAVMAERAKRATGAVNGTGLGSAVDYAVALSAGRYKVVPHLAYLMAVLDDAAMHGGRRIIVSMPVRHGKSWSTSHYFPVSFLDRWPARNIILTGYEASFARSWGRKVRNTVDENPDALRVRLSTDSTAADVFATTEGGGMVTAGVGGPITGRPADLLLIDDPIKNWAEAQSQLKRDSIWEWWTGTAFPRLEPNASVVVTMARWHQDDFVGRLLQHATQGGDQWTEIRIPAIAGDHDPLGRAPGDALWPERYNVAALEKIRATTTENVWNALYQQNPSAPGGSTFRRAWLTQRMARPAHVVSACRAWDCAATRDGGDWTVGVLLATLSDGRFVVLDVVRVQYDPGDVDRLIKATAALDGRGVIIREEQEGGSSGKAVTARRKSELPGHDYDGVRSTGDKESRWMGAAAAANAGNLVLVDGAAWVPTFVEELVSVPTARNDDQADALSLAYNTLTAPKGAPPRVRAVGIAGFQ